MQGKSQNKDNQNQHHHQKELNQKPQLCDLQTIQRGKKVSPEISTFLNQYLNFMGISNQSTKNFHFEKQTAFQFDQIIFKLRKNKIYLVEDYQPKFTVLQTNHSLNYQVIQITVQMSYFQTKIVVFNSQNQSCFHHQLFISKFGGTGNIYFVKSHDQNYAVKCIKINQKNFRSQTKFDSLNFLQDFTSILKQYFFVLIFSALEIGPKAKKIYGFDLIVYQTCIQFSTQLCQQLPSAVNQLDSKTLISDLKLVHSLKIVHDDIKLVNVMYSQQYKKNVFIDFGGTTFVKQTIGTRSAASFIGTIGYCGPQMIQNLRGQYSLVDLYYNDVFGLQKTINAFVSFRENNVYVESRIQAYKGQKLKNNNNFLIYFKYLYWTKQIENVNLYSNQFLNNLTQQNQNQFLQFARNMFPFQKYVNSFSKLDPSKNRYIPKCILHIYNSKIFTKLKETSQLQEHFFINNQQEVQQRKTFYNKLYTICKDQENKRIQSVVSQKDIIEDILSNLSTQNQKLKAEQFNFYLIKYISLTQRQYGQTLNNKLNNCKKYLSLKQNQKQQTKAQNQQQNQKSLEWNTFVNVFKLLFMNDFMSKNKFLRQEYTLTLLKNYFLLYYQSFTFQDLFSKIKWVNKITFKERVLLFWKCFAIFYSYSLVILNSKQQLKQLQQQQLTTFYQNTFPQTNLNQDQKQLAEQSQYFYDTLRKKRHQINDTSYDKVTQRVLNFQLFKELSQAEYYELRYNIVFSAYQAMFITGAAVSAGHTAGLFHIFNTHATILSKNQISIGILGLSRIYGTQKNFIMVGKTFSFIDSIIDFFQVSIRYHTKLRFELAFYKRDQSTIKQIMKIISKLNTSLHSHFSIVFELIYSVQFIDFYIIYSQQKQFQKRCFLQLKILLQKGLECLDQSSKSLDYNKNQKLFYLQSKSLSTQNVVLKIKNISNLMSMLLLFIESLISLKIPCFQYMVQTERQVRDMFKLLGRSLLKICHQSQYIELYLIFMTRFCLFQQHTTFLQELEAVQKHDPNYKSMFQKVDNTLSIRMRQAQFLIFLIFNRIATFDHEKQDYILLLKFYEMLVKLKNISLLSTYRGLILYIWRTFVICQVGYPYMYTFLKLMTYFLSVHPSKIYLENFDIQIKFISFCKCVQCYPFQNNFKPLQFVKYIYQKLMAKQKNSPQFVLIYFYCLRSKQITSKMKKQFLLAIFTKIKYLSHSMKDIILAKLYLYVFQDKQSIRKSYVDDKLLINSRQEHTLDQIVKLRSKYFKKNLSKSCLKVSSSQFKLIKEKLKSKIRKYHKVKQNYKFQ